MLDALTRASFELHLNTTFRLHLEDVDALDLELIEASDKTPERFNGEQFSLIFKGPPDPFLPQQTYTLEHAAMGRLDLFLVPVDQKKDGFRYEAYFNRAALEED